MDDKTRDLILDLASGDLPPEEAKRLEQSLSPEAAEELAAHRSLLAMIAEAPAPAMTEAERMRLVDGVATVAAETTRELNAVEIVQPARRRRIRWMPIAAAASTLAVFGAVAVTGSTLMSGGDDDGVATAQLTTTTASPATTMAAGGLSAPEMAIGNVFALSDAEVVESGDVEFVAEQGATVDELRDVLDTTLSRRVVLDPKAQPCAGEAASSSGAELNRAHFGLYEQTKVILFAYDAPPDDDSMGVLVYDASTCELLPRSPDGRLGDAPSP